MKNRKRTASPPISPDPLSAVAAEEGISVWAATQEMPAPPPLTGKPRVDVCVVGAGITGISTAYLLTREGRSVAVLERQPQLGGSETRYTTAHLVTALDTSYRNLVQYHGEDGARQAAASHASAIDKIETIAREEGIACDFRRLDGYLFGAGERKDAKVLQQEFEAARAAGVPVEKVSTTRIAGVDLGPSIRFPNQAQFHPLKYLARLVEILRERRVKIFAKTEVTEVREEDDGKLVRVIASDGAEVEAGHVVIATNTPFIDWVTMHTKQFPYRTYAIGMRVRESAEFPPVLLWDTAEPFHYVRTHHDPESGTILIVGGEDHKTGQADDARARYARLEAWARERFGSVAGEVAYRWSGQVIQSMDGLAFTGKNPKSNHSRVVIHTGDSGNGMTHGTIAAMLLTDLIQGRSNEWADLYDPARKNLRAAKEFAAENLNVAAQYADWVTPGEAESEAEVAPGTGVVVRRGLQKIAVHRDDEGHIYERSAVCTHLGCIVAWNNAEKSWDCPCHGSRFSPQGAVLNGPANAPLAEVQLAEDAPASTPPPQRRRKDDHHASR